MLSFQKLDVYQRAIKLGAAAPEPYPHGYRLCVCKCLNGFVRRSVLCEMTVCDCAKMPVCSDFWPSKASVLDQLRRASCSVSLNIAEAAGRTGTADAARTYAIARGSAMECAAVLDALLILKVVGASTRGIEIFERIVAMLTKLCR